MSLAVFGAGRGAGSGVGAASGCFIFSRRLSPTVQPSGVRTISVPGLPRMTFGSRGTTTPISGRGTGGAGSAGGATLVGAPPSSLFVSTVTPGATSTGAACVGSAEGSRSGTTTPHLSPSFQTVPTSRSASASASAFDIPLPMMTPLPSGNRSPTLAVFQSNPSGSSLSAVSTRTPGATSPGTGCAEACC